CAATGPEIRTPNSGARKPRRRQAGSPHRSEKTAYPEFRERPPRHRDSAEFHSFATIPSQSAANALMDGQRVLLGFRSRRRFRQHETIADAGLGGDEDRFAAPRFNLLAQLIDEDAEIFDLIAVLGSPDRLQQALVR